MQRALVTDVEDMTACSSAGDNSFTFAWAGDKVAMSTNAMGDGPVPAFLLEKAEYETLRQWAHQPCPEPSEVPVQIPGTELMYYIEAATLLFEYANLIIFDDPQAFGPMRERLRSDEPIATMDPSKVIVGATS